MNTSPGGWIAGINRGGTVVVAAIASRLLIPIIKIGFVFLTGSGRRQIFKYDAIQRIILHRSYLPVRIRLRDHILIVVILVMPMAHIRIVHIFDQRSTVIDEGHYVAARIFCAQQAVGGIPVHRRAAPGRSKIRI